LLLQVSALLYQESVAGLVTYDQLPSKAMEAAQAVWLAAVTRQQPPAGVVEDFLAAVKELA
jgi:hypothetical protein